ncbi:emerin [Gadus morhua]|uniref:LEM domain-containing protein n=1 Tax=Gadus morhua TaxID=8049 RepID=A0A8C4YZQ3_GADMO|nr:emerin [Gadus morhua]
MSTLSNKSDQEISALLDEYGIKHGPIVDSTRSLYEKKIQQAMGNKGKAKPSSDKTYYREEEEEVTYLSYRSPSMSEGYGDREQYSHSGQEYAQRNLQDENPYLRSRSEVYRSPDVVDKHYDTPLTYSTASYSNATPVKCSVPVPEEKSHRLIPLWVQFLVFLIVAVFLYFVICNMESTHSEPFKQVK